jgi:ceramide kinase
MFAELCHGLLLRTAHDEQINIDNPQVNIIRPKLRIGIIPAGSTDAVVFGTTGLNDPVTSALQIIVGESLLIDITTVKKKTNIFF